MRLFFAQIMVLREPRPLCGDFYCVGAKVYDDLRYFIMATRAFVRMQYAVTYYTIAVVARST